MERLVDKYASGGGNLMEVLVAGEIVGGDKGYASGVLELRPEVYMVRNGTVYWDEKSN